MTAVVLSVIVGWLLLSALTTAAFALLARGGAQEDARQRRLDAELRRLLAGGDGPRPAVPEPDGTAR